MPGYVRSVAFVTEAAIILAASSARPAKVADGTYAQNGNETLWLKLNRCGSQ